MKRKMEEREIRKRKIERKKRRVMIEETIFITFNLGIFTIRM